MNLRHRSGCKSREVGRTLLRVPCAIVKTQSRNGLMVPSRPSRRKPLFDCNGSNIQQILLGLCIVESGDFQTLDLMILAK